MAKLNREQKREIARVVRKTLLSWSEGKKPKHTDTGICGNLEKLKIPFVRCIYDIRGIKNVLEKANPDLFGGNDGFPIKHPFRGNIDAFFRNRPNLWQVKGKSTGNAEYTRRRKLACKILARSKKTIVVDEDNDVSLIFGDTTNYSDCL